MNSILRFLIATGIWFLVTGILGYYLRRKGKPYNILILVIHGILSIFIITGVIFSIIRLQGITNSKLFSTIAVYLMALSVVIKIISGLFIPFIKNKQPIVVHRIGTYLMVVSIIAGIIFQSVRI